MDKIYIVYHHDVDSLISYDRDVYSIHDNPQDGIRSVARAYEQLEKNQREYEELLRTGAPNNDKEFYEIEDKLSWLLSRTKAYNRYSLEEVTLDDETGEVISTCMLDNKTGKRIF